MSTNSDSDAYVLGRNSSETHRLDAQHTLILRATKGLLYHPSLGDLSQFSCILDSAAGTAVWAAHVAAGGGGEEGWQVTKLREGCVVEASDISGKQVPDPLPRGVSAFYEQDVTKPFPPDKLGRYDLIHQRLAGPGLVDWPAALRNLKDALRPGGYLVLHETSNNWTSSGEIPSIRKFEIIINDMCTVTGFNCRLNEDLVPLLAEAGFTSISPHPYLFPYGPSPLAQPLGPSFVSSTLTQAKEIYGPEGPVPKALQRLREAGNGGGLAGDEEVKEVLRGMVQEIERYGAEKKNVIVVARKPLDER